MVLDSTHGRSGSGAFGPRSSGPGAARKEHHPTPRLVDSRLLDHATGLELQLVDAVEERTRARVQGNLDRARDIEREIDRLHDELAETAARVAAGA